MRTFAIIAAAALCAALSSPAARADKLGVMRSMFRADVSFGGAPVVLGQHGSVRTDSVASSYVIASICTYPQNQPHPGGRGRGQMYLGFNATAGPTGPVGKFRLVITREGGGAAVYESAAAPVAQWQAQVAALFPPDPTPPRWIIGPTGIQFVPTGPLPQPWPPFVTQTVGLSLVSDTTGAGWPASASAAIRHGSKPLVP